MSGPTQQYDWGSVGGSDTPSRTRPERLPVPAHISSDIGLLLLRLSVGGLFAAHGAQKVFGVLGGLGPVGTDGVLAGLGFAAFASPLAWVLGVVELVFGALVVLGLFTPFAAAGLLSIKMVAVAVYWGAVPLFAAAGPNALELHVLLGGGAAALVFTSAGRIALDAGRTWQRRPLPYAVLSLILAAAAALLVFFVLRR
jgi:putative oxidoreductase